MATLDLSKALGSGGLSISGNFPAGFVGPILPGQTIGGVNPLRDKPAVLAAAASRAPAPISGSRGGAPTPGVTSTPNQQTQAGPNGNDINDLYAPQLGYLDQMQSQAGAAKVAQLGDLDTQYAAESAKLKPEEQMLNANLEGQQNKFNTDIRSAYDEAYRAHNALNQQANARFGRGGSAYGAVSDLANQELLRQVGKVGEQSTQGQLAFSQEFTKVKNYITGKLSDLDSWKRDAVGKINDNFSQMMAQINSNRVATEQQKTKDKMGLLQQTIAQNQAIQQADQTFKQQLAMFSVQQMANVTGKTFTPQEIQAHIADIMGNINLGASTPAAGPALVGQGGGAILGKNNSDQYGTSLT
jgi:hypothetical protein